MKPIDEIERNNIMKIFLKIQSSTTKPIFDSAKNLFLNKHKSSKNKGVQALCTYLKENWFTKNKNGCYEGY